ncbi:MAG: hypothetical protein AAGA46_00410 [Cyanobacteria bacterium P01_F01_bin.13]
MSRTKSAQLVRLMAGGSLMLATATVYFIDAGWGHVALSTLVFLGGFGAGYWTRDLDG